LSAAAGSLSGAIGAVATVQGQLVNMFNTAVEQISNTLTGFWNSVKSVLSDLIFVLWVLALLVAWAYYVQTGGQIPPGGFPI
jgi:hypothetical protein